MTVDVPAPLLELLSSKVNSFEKLELVVALHAAPQSTSTIDVLSKRLGYSREALYEAAVELRSASLVMFTSNEVQLAPPTDRERETLAKLVAAYENDRVAIIKALGEVALARIRNMASTVFADAFVIRKKRRDGDG